MNHIVFRIAIINNIADESLKKLQQKIKQFQFHQSELMKLA